MFNLDDITTKKDNKGWPYRTLVIGSSGSGKTYYLLNKIQTDNNIIDKIYLYCKDLEEPQYRLLIDKRKQAGIKNLKDKHKFIEYSNSVNDIDDNIDDYSKKEEEKF